MVKRNFLQWHAPLYVFIVGFSGHPRMVNTSVVVTVVAVSKMVGYCSAVNPCGTVT